MSGRPDEGDDRRARPPEVQPPRTGDAFGACLLACWEGGATPWAAVELVERDDGFLAGADAARYFAPPAAWGPLDRWACGRARGRVLNVGSGPNATYQVQLIAYLTDPTCATTPLPPIPEATLTTNAAGNGEAQFVFHVQDVPAAVRHTTDGLVWQVTRGGQVAYQTACTVVRVD